MSVKLAIVGSRNFHMEFAFENIVSEWIKKHNKNPDVIISGGANGVDRLAKNYAKKFNIRYIEFPAKWNKYGDSAGPKRNSLIANECTHCLALPSRTGRGTQDTIRKVQELQKPIMIEYID